MTSVKILKEFSGPLFTAIVSMKCFQSPRDIVLLSLTTYISPKLIQLSQFNLHRFLFMKTFPKLSGLRTSYRRVALLSGFLMIGGVLGMYCSHDYAHASTTVNRRLPGTMKGLDAVVWTICEIFNLPVIALPVFLPDDDGSDEDDYDSGNEADTDACSRWDPLGLFNWESQSRAHLNQSGGFDWIGTDFEPIYRTWSLGDQEDRIGRRMPEAGFCSKYRGIYWLNGPRHSEANVAYTTVFYICLHGLILVRQ